MDNVQDILPLTPVQQGMLFHSLEAPDRGIYCEQVLVTLRGSVNVAAMEGAATDLQERHAALRAMILWEGLERPVQVIRSSVEPTWDYRDFSSESDRERLVLEQQFLADDREAGFDLGRGPLLRFALLQLSPDTARLVLSFHHIIADGWSLRLLLRDLGQLYRSRCEGTSHTLRPAPAFGDYIAWLDKQPLAQAEAFWRQQLSGLAAPTPLARHSAGKPVAGAGRRGEQRLLLDEACTEALVKAARVYGVTTNTLAQAAWSLVLGRYTAEDDLLFGTTLAGRPHQLPGVEDTVGLFIETIPSRVRFDPERKLGDFLAALQGTQQEAAEHGHCGLTRIREWSELPAGSELFDSLLVFESMPAQGDDSSHFGDLEQVDTTFLEQSNYPLALLVIPATRWELLAIHDLRHFDTPLVVRLLASFATALRAIAAAHADTPLAELSSLGETETDQLAAWGRGASLEPAASSWLELLDDAIARTPQAIALQAGDERHSYRDLDNESLRRARRLVALGVTPGDRIGVHALRTPDTLLSVIALLRAGAVYVPIEPTQPLARRRSIVRDGALDWWLGGSPDDHPGTRHIDLDNTTAGSDDTALPESTRSDLAYVIYTSGSTGIPRGVAVTHGNLLYSTAAREVYYPEPVGRFLLLSSLGFDSSVAGIFWTLSRGGTLVLPALDRHDEVEHLLSVAADSQISHLLCVPSLYQLLMECAGNRLDSLRIAIVAGESCPARLVREHAEQLPRTRLYNEYGPTEATVWSSVEEPDLRQPASSVSIGGPIPGVRLLLLDRHGRRAPIGTPAELCIAGPTVAQGYLNHPEETARRFQAEPFEPHQVMYRSGDIARWGENGKLEYIGREDGQVKLRGRRIEVGEIEAVLGEFTGVLEAAVLLRPGATDTPVSIDALEAALDALPPQEAEAMLAAVENDTRGDSHKLSGPGWALNLQLQDDFLAPPRELQRRWLIRQFLQEASSDIRQLSEQASRFVPGSDALLERTGDVTGLDLDADDIMEDWQIPILEAMAEVVTAQHGHVLEIGFGRGISAAMIQRRGVRAHTIIEANEHCIRRYYEPWRAQFAERDIRIIHSDWQDACAGLASFDGVFFHTAARDMEELANATVDQVTYAEHFFPTAAALLRPGGVFTYLANDIDSLSRAHQRLLLRHFSSFSLRRIDGLQIPGDTRDVWWAPSMVVVGAVK